MNHLNPILIPLTVAVLGLSAGCAGPPKVQRPPTPPPSLASPMVLPPIETLQWGDLARDCGQLKTEYDRLAPLVKDAGRLFPLPRAPIPRDPGTSLITFIPLFGPLMAMSMDSAAREQAAFDAAQIATDPTMEAAILAHQRGHEALDRRQYVTYLASQKGCK